MLNIATTLESGQFFRYQKIGEWYYCNERDTMFKVRANTHTGTTATHFKRLFGLHHDYERIISALREDKKLLPFIDAYPGLRVMQRDPWETLVSFQCSIMNNVKKIQLNMELLAKTFGKPLSLDEIHSFSFPNPGELNNIDKIKQCATGFRAKYIHAANALVDDAYFAKLKRKTYADAKHELIELPGVAEKVADCICLFGLGKLEAFPVDVWIERAMSTLYFDNKKTSLKNIHEFAVEQWGPYAGYAQQFLYHGFRQAPRKTNP